MKFIPKGEWVLIKELVQKHGILEIADYYGLTHDMMIGEVIAVGTGIKKGNKVIPLEAQPGDRVTFHRKAREPVRLDLDDDGIAEDYLLVKETRIDATLPA